MINREYIIDLLIKLAKIENYKVIRTHHNEVKVAINNDYNTEPQIFNPIGTHYFNKGYMLTIIEKHKVSISFKNNTVEIKSNDESINKSFDLEGNFDNICPISFSVAQVIVKKHFPNFVVL
jgi:hypothetical protein